MNTRTESSIQRRDVLKAGLLAVGAALLPSAATAAVATGSGALEQLRADYQRRVEAFAARLLPEYAHVDEATMMEGEVLDAARALEEACREEFCPTEDVARVVLAVSPHWAADDWLSFYDVRKGIACAVALDVAVAMRAEWYLRGAGIDDSGEA